MQDEVSFSLLGPLEVTRGGRRVPITALRHLTTLAALALQANRTVSTAQLTAAVWGADPPATAANQIAICVLALRRALGRAAGMIETRPRGYLLNVPPGATDLDRVEAMVDAGRALEQAGRPAAAVTELRTALDLWRGPVLCGITSPELQPEIAGWEERRLGLTEEVYSLELRLDRHDGVVAELAAFAGAHPLRERPRGLLMLALYRTGRQAEALGVFRETSRLLSEELGLRPSAELRALERSILNQDPRLRPRYGRRSDLVDQVGH